MVTVAELALCACSIIVPGRHLQKLGNNDVLRLISRVVRSSVLAVLCFVALVVQCAV